MPRFAANITTMFNELPFLDRFDAAAAAGFTAVECIHPYAFAPDELAARLARNNLTQALFNLPAGDMEAGERGLAVYPERFDKFKASVAQALPFVEATGVKRLHLMSGLADRRDQAARAAYLAAIEYAADRFAPYGVTILLEPINPRHSPGYFMNDTGLAEDIIAALGRPNVQLQFDFFHQQIIHGDVTMNLRRLLPLIEHIQIASVPSRHEPDSEELNYPFIFDELDRLGYAGAVGCEYRPRGDTVAGLSWFAPYRASQQN